MADYMTAQIRNVALTGHPGAGKTLLLDALLHAGGVIPAVGSIDKGNTVGDHDPLEHRHQHSLTASLAELRHGESHINLLDTPGYPDFFGAALGVLPAVETVAVVINAQAGVETMTRRFMEWAAQRRFCRMIIVNKIDVESADLQTCYDEIRESFGHECLAVNLPAEGGKTVVDCFFKPDGQADFSSVEEAHTMIVDQTVEVDEELMARYLDTGEVDPAQLHDAFEEALREGHLVPVCFVSAQTGAGVRELLDVIDRLMPNPAEGNPPLFENGEGERAEPVEVMPDPDRHVLAHVFRVTFDPFVGKQAWFRMHQGTLRKDSQVFVGDARKPLKIGAMYSLVGKQQVERGTAIPGDIRMIAKVDSVGYDSVLHDSHDEDLIHLRPPPLPEPMVGVAVAPKSRGDEQKIADVLNKLIEEDPCLRLERNPAANETVLRGLGDLHLRVAIERMQSQYNVEVVTGEPTIPYRETVTRKAEGHCRHKKQTGGAGQFGEVFLRVEPLPRGSGFEFASEVVGGVIPTPLIPAVEKGVRQALDSGAVAGFPVVDVRVVVFDGKHHPVDSKEVAFVTAGKKAFLDAVSKARPVILEPIANISITAPGANLGDIAGDLSSRRGRVNSTDSLAGGMMTVAGQVPLAELSDYPSRLKSMTGGEGSYALEFAGYEPTPAEVQKRLEEGYQRPADE